MDRDRNKYSHKRWNIQEVKMLYRKKLYMDEPSNVLDPGLDYMDSPTERVHKWLWNNRKVEQQTIKTPKKMLTVQLPIRLFNSFK